MDKLEIQLEYYIIKKHVKAQCCNNFSRSIVKGFTLAEVLITLAVVGTLAAMSIPSLIANANNQAYVTGLKKFYTEFGSAIQKYAADQGSIGNLAGTPIFARCNGTHPETYCDDDGNCDTSDYCNLPPGSVFGWGVLGKYFNQIKDCSVLSTIGINPPSTSCWVPDSQINFNISGTMKGMGYFTDYSTQAMLANGMSVAIRVYNGCSSSDDPHASCGVVYVDVNGKKSPNQFGRDIFALTINRNATLSGGEDYNSGGDLSTVGGTIQACDPKSDDGTGVWGSWCAARIIAENWQMNY